MMSRSTVLAFVLYATAAMPLAAGACAPGTGGHIIPRPTKPAEPRSPTDLLLRMALAEVLKEPRESVLPRRGPVLLLRDGPHVSPHILPADTAQGIALVSADQLEALAAQPGTDHYYYLSLRVLSMDAQQAVVNVQLFPAIAKGSIAMCCWTIDRRYLRTAAGWTFDRLVGGGVY
jgi:hypothetical protein